MKTTLRNLLAALLVLAPVCLFAQFAKLYDFSQQSGREPYGSLILDEAAQVLYGLTYEGGTNDDGTLFRYDLNTSTYTKLVDFDTPTGIKPRGSLLKVGSTLFGMTSEEGANDAGTIFKVLANGTGFTTLFPFVLNNTGGTPFGSLTLVGDILYGMTYDGGANGMGTIFRMDTSAVSFSVLHEFNGDNGSGPYGDLLQDGDYLYGMTKYGGTGNFGVIFKFKISSSGYNNVMNFDWTNTGGYPDGSLTLHDGYLYGMTSAGGDHSDGTLFKISAGGTGFTKLFDFQGSVNGESPWGNLVFYNGVFYGQVDGNGTLNNGSLFTIAPDGSNYTTLYSFTEPLNGTEPKGTPVVEPIFDGVNLYGMMQNGGVNDYGVIFKYTDQWSAIDPGTGRPQVAVFPNPVTDFLNIRSAVPVTEVTISGLAGNEVFRGVYDAREIRIPLNSLISGFYFVKIAGDGISVTEKILKE